jgi:pilus assembly protein CpaE
MADGDTIRVMIVDDIIDTRDQLEKLLFFEKDIEVVAKASSGREAVAFAKQYKPDVILMDINMPDMDGIVATEAILTQDPTIQVIIMSVQGETDYMRRAMLAGAREFLTKPISADDLYKSIRHVHRLASTRPQMVAQHNVVSNDPGGASGGSQGQVIAVFSPKGGVGTSVVAVNLAVALRQLTNKKVALIDGNFMFGDMAVMMNLTSTKTVIDLANRISDLDRELLNDVLTTHTSQVKVLLAPPNPQAGELVTSDHLRAILDVMRREFDYIVVDTESSIQDRAITVLDTADRIVVLMTLELTCIKNIKLFLEVAELLEYPKEKMVLVLNKADNRLGIRVENVEGNIQHKVALQIANAAQDITLSINQGVPLVIEKRSHQMSKDIFALAATLTNVAKAAEKGKATEAATKAKAAEARGGLFSRLTGRR